MIVSGTTEEEASSFFFFVFFAASASALIRRTPSVNGPVAFTTTRARTSNSLPRRRRLFELESVPELQSHSDAAAASSETSTHRAPTTRPVRSSLISEFTRT